jgi:UTP-glucose-1-phosphate uridylyltransferase
MMLGDTLFLKDFNLQDAISTFEHVSRMLNGNLVTYYDCREEDVSRTGILQLEDGSGKVVGFWEKPDPKEVASRSAR